MIRSKLQDQEARLHNLLKIARTQDNPLVWRDFLKAITPYLHHWVGRKIHMQAMREDVVQECLLAIYVKQANYDDHHPLMPWLAAVTRYKLVDALRKQNQASHAYAVDGDALSDMMSEAGQLAHPDDFTRRDATKMIEQLTVESEREALSKVTLDQLSHAEAAQELGISTGNLRIRIYRATEKLKKMIAKELNP
ncbi:MAG: sigma-70 family RNA polymerase sigma factor [Alphaproteobacteria bacterium]